jgi:hypothetical protein
MEHNSHKLGFQSVPVQLYYKLEMITEAEYDLWKAEIEYITNNQGVHIMLMHEGKVGADFWPTTGLVKFRKGQSPQEFRTKVWAALKKHHNHTTNKTS